MQPELNSSTTSATLMLLLFPPPVPDELRPIPFLGRKQGGGEGLGKARVVEADAEIVFRVVAIRPGIPGVPNAGVADVKGVSASTPSRYIGVSGTPSQKTRPTWCSRNWTPAKRVLTRSFLPPWRSLGRGRRPAQTGSVSIN